MNKGTLIVNGIDYSNGGGGSAIVEYGTTEEFKAVKDSLPVGTSYCITDDYDEYGERYSTNERRIGTWIDGKPLYQKLVVQPLTQHTGNAVTSKSYNHNIADVDHIHVNAGVSFYQTNDTDTVPISYAYPSAQTCVGISAIGNTTYSLNTYGNRSAWVAHMFFEYTKTTDQGVRE